MSPTRARTRDRTIRSRAYNHLATAHPTKAQLFGTSNYRDFPERGTDCITSTTHIETDILIVIFFLEVFILKGEITGLALLTC